MSKHVWELKSLSKETVGRVLDHVVMTHQLRVNTFGRPGLHKSYILEPTDGTFLELLEQRGTALICYALEADRQSSGRALHRYLTGLVKVRPATLQRPEYIGRMWKLLWPHLEAALQLRTEITADKFSAAVAADWCEECNRLPEARFLRVLANEPVGPQLHWFKTPTGLRLACMVDGSPKFKFNGKAYYHAPQAAEDA